MYINIARALKQAMTTKNEDRMFLVTGGAGFIGSNLVHALVAQNKDVVVCDWMGQENKWKNIAPCDLYSIIAPEELLQFLSQNAARIKGVFHLGAISTTTERNVDLIVNHNIRLSQSLWGWCSIHKKPLIYASSAATYGDGPVFKDVDSVEELAHLHPLNAYGWSKHFFDRWVARMRASNAEQPSQCVGLKFFNVYGPNEYHKGAQQSVAVHLFHQIQSGKNARLFKSYNKKYEDGGQIRDFVFVEDCVDVMLWLYDNPQVNGLLNVGSSKGRSFKDLALAVYAALGKEPNIEYIDMPEGLAAQYQYYTEAEMTKLKAAGYTKPLTSLEDGVRKYIQEFLMKDEGYRQGW